MSDATFEQVKQMIEQLPPDEVERPRVWLLSTATEKPDEPDTPLATWGQRVAALIENFPQEEDQMAIGDPEAWTHERRRTKTQRRNPGWGEA